MRYWVFKILFQNSNPFSTLHLVQRWHVLTVTLGDHVWIHVIVSRTFRAIYVSKFSNMLVSFLSLINTEEGGRNTVCKNLRIVYKIPFSIQIRPYEWRKNFKLQAVDMHTLTSEHKQNNRRNTCEVLRVLGFRMTLWHDPCRRISN